MNRPRKPPGNARYLGDGVWGWFDGFQIWIGTYDGTSITELIALEPGTMYSLMQFATKEYGEPIIPSRGT